MNFTNNKKPLKRGFYTVFISYYAMSAIALRIFDAMRLSFELIATCSAFSKAILAMLT